MKRQKSMPFYFQSLRALLDYFIPAQWPEGNKRNRARNVVATSIAYVVLVGPFVPIFIWQGNSMLSVFVLCTVLNAVALVLVMRKKGSLPIALTLSLINSILLCPVAWYLGGRDDPGFPYMYSLLPITCTFIFGASAGFLATLFAIGVSMLLSMAPDYDWLPYLHQPMRNPELMHTLYLAGTVGAAGLLAILFQFSKTVSDLALQEARRHSEQLAAVKSQFLANMSHEIRTPMNAIIGLSGLAVHHDMPARVQDYLGKIKFSAEHLLGIINDILDFSKIESGKMEIESVPFDLESLISNVVNLVADKVDAQKLEFLCKVDPAIPRTLVGDPLRISQILINLANNAVKFTHQGEIRISISMQSVEDNMACVLFEVQDTGIGLSPEQMGKLFNSFEQADASTTRQYGGTGLGLTISKGLAEAMQGSIGVRSVLGQGSTFWFTVKLGISSAERYLPALPQMLRGRRVLVVDDNEAAGLLLSDTLSELGFVVDHARSGPAALALMRAKECAENPYAFVMMDWLMPDMDGLATIKAIQSQHAGTAPYILMVTAHRREEVVRGAQALGVAHVLTKPVSGSLLFNTMMQLMGLAHSGAESGGSARTPSAFALQLQRIHGARMLLVEDNEINQQVACEILLQAGCVVDVAENGRLAVQQVQARHAQGLAYDLVLMDMQMPVMDGLTSTRLIRTSFSADQLPIVAMTANAMKADRARCLAAGMNDFVSKPIDPEGLWSVLLAWVKVREGMGQAEVQLPAPEQPSQDVLALLEALRQIPDLDVELGLTRTNNKPTFYLSMLRRMLATEEDAPQRIMQCLAQGDGASAARAAHTLGGLAANMGATLLQASAQKLELALKTDAPIAERDACLRDAQERLQLLVNACKAIPGMVPTERVLNAEALSPKDHQQAEKVVRHVRSLLEEDDAKAVEEWESHADLLGLIYPQAAAIGEAIGRFEFQEALDLLQAIATPASRWPLV